MTKAIIKRAEQEKAKLTGIMQKDRANLADIRKCLNDLRGIQGSELGIQLCDELEKHFVEKDKDSRYLHSGLQRSFVMLAEIFADHLALISSVENLDTNVELVRTALKLYDEIMAAKAS